MKKRNFYMIMAIVGSFLTIADLQAKSGGTSGGGGTRGGGTRQGPSKETSRLKITIYNLNNYPVEMKWLTAHAGGRSGSGMSVGEIASKGLREFDFGINQVDSYRVTISASSAQAANVGMGIYRIPAENLKTGNVTLYVSEEGGGDYRNIKFLTPLEAQKIVRDTIVAAQPALIPDIAGIIAGYVTEPESPSGPGADSVAAPASLSFGPK